MFNAADVEAGVLKALRPARRVLRPFGAGVVLKILLAVLLISMAAVAAEPKIHDVELCPPVVVPGDTVEVKVVKVRRA